MPSLKDRLDDLLAQHRQFLALAQTCINKDRDECGNAQLAELMSHLAERLEAHALWLDERAATHGHIGEEAVHWGPITSTRKVTRKGSPVRLVVSGPSPGDSLDIKIDNKSETADQIVSCLQVSFLFVASCLLTHPRKQKYNSTTKW